MSTNAAILAGFSAVFLGGVYTYFPELIIPAGILAAIPWIKFFVFDTPKAKLALNPEKWQQFVLIDKTKKSHNVALYRFALPNPNDILGLPIGQHISVQAEIGEKTVQRSYTPTSSDDDRGYFELLIKTYPTGVVSKYFDELKIGQPITVKGPRGKFLYKPGLVNAFGMIAGGTGITPMLQIIRAILKNPSDRTKINLIFANVNYDDILLKDELDHLAARHDNFEVHYVLNNPPEGWTGGVGFVTAAMIQEHCPAPAKDIKILLCGPPPMVSAMSQHAEALGYDKPRALSKLEDQVFKF